MIRVMEGESFSQEFQLEDANGLVDLEDVLMHLRFWRDGSVLSSIEATQDDETGHFTFSCGVVGSQKLFESDPDMYDVYCTFPNGGFARIAKGPCKATGK